MNDFGFAEAERKAKERLQKDVERLQVRVDALEAALEVYADPQYWNKDGSHERGLGPGIAKRAPKALEGERK